MTNSNITPRLHVEAKRLAEIFPTDHEWFWDDASRSLLTVLRGDECKGIREALTSTCKMAWDHESAAKIDSRYQGLMQKLMGVHKDQSLHTTPLSNSLTLFATYWPWVGGTRVSVRIGVYNDSTGDNEVSGCIDALKKVFHADQPLYFRSERNASMPRPKLSQNASPAKKEEQELPKPMAVAKTVTAPSIRTTRAALQTITQRSSSTPRPKPVTRSSGSVTKHADLEELKATLPEATGQLQSVIDSSVELIEMLRASRSNAQTSLSAIKRREGKIIPKTPTQSYLNSFRPKKSGTATGSFGKKR